MLHTQKPQIHVIEREVQKVTADIVFDNNEPIEYVKEYIAHEIVEFLKPFIEWDIKDDNTEPFKKRMFGEYIFSKENQ